MRATFFNQGTEYVLEIDGESWTQGQKITGSVQTTDVNYEVSFGLLDLKKQKKGETDFFKVDQTLGDGTINFNIDMNFPISEKSSTPAVALIKDGNFIGSLNLPVGPHTIISSFTESLKVFLRFQLKTIKSNKKGEIDHKFILPQSKELGGVEQLNIFTKLTNENQLDLKYQFKIKRLSYQQEGVQAKAVKEVYNQTLNDKDLFIFGGSPNQDGMVNKVNEILEEVKRKTLF